ncbi:MAG: antitoxin of toxin-antitoxin stability system [Caulobacter sp. 12-67-6]|nr:MAG: antitoxin of toxin-antitoxin stability system [Caulobacter sp. 12-67-6]OYX72522.1 MAG: antitoxin of toxin-antitoxin stability system [Caulobacter sp. 32-67-35]OYX92226.1 MAG: antitoxin of toxin-antitoxin stability system [Caulobacter sp. 35-67-4]HQR88318.1 antitoxin of toxin-antitoxin stability system [Caulobacter sp.]
MSKDAVFTLKLEAQLRDAFVAEAQASHRPASQIVRDLMRDFVERQRQARLHDEFLRRKVEIARAERLSGLTDSDENVEAEFAARRAELLRKADEAAA